VYVWRGVLIDTGFPVAGGHVARAVAELRPRGAILTHGHEDHAGNADVVAAAGVPLWHSPLTPAVMRDNRAMGAYRRITWGRPRTLALPEPRFDPGPLELLHTPGHSADHHIVWDEEREVLFSSDLWLGVRVAVARPDEDPRALVRSLRRAAELRPKAMWDAHRGAVANPVSALGAKADWIEALIERVERLAATGMADELIARETLGRPGLVDAVSFGDLSRVNLVRAIRRSA
jgi:glyoxylase-like metal-dependent hydrolase (beta-lactamase superfamily II)